MPILPFSNRVKFNQCWRYEDIRTGFNCFAYCVLFFNHIMAQRFLFPNRSIDYSHLKKTLTEYQNKAELQASQDHYTTCYYSMVFHKFLKDFDIAALFNRELLLLHKSEGSEHTGNLEALLKAILKDLHNQAYGNFYSLEIASTQTFLKMPLSHIVCMYLASADELHFFDANSGVYSIHLANDLSSRDLKETLINLIFKQNIIIQYAFDSSQNNIQYTMTRSKVSTQKSLIESINNYLAHPELVHGVNRNPSLDKISIQFLERLFFAIQIQRDNQANRKNLINYFSNFFKPISSNQIDFRENEDDYQKSISKECVVKKQP